MSKSRKRKRGVASDDYDIKDTDSKEFNSLEEKFNTIMGRIFDPTKIAFEVRVEDDDGKVRNIYDIKAMDPNRLRIKSDDTTLYKFQHGGLWKDRLSGKNYDDHEMLHRLLVMAAPNLTIVPSYILPNDMFFDDDEKLYYQENFVKRRDPDFDDPNRYMNFAATNDMTSDFEVSAKNPTKRNIAHRFELIYNLS